MDTNPIENEEEAAKEATLVENSNVDKKVIFGNVTQNGTENIIGNPTDVRSKIISKHVNKATKSYKDALVRSN